MERLDFDYLKREGEGEKHTTLFDKLKESAYFGGFY